MGLNKIIFVWCLATSAILMVISFFTPPQGVIDKSVLQASAILLAFASIPEIKDVISGKDVSVKHKDTEITIKEDESD